MECEFKINLKLFNLVLKSQYSGTSFIVFYKHKFYNEAKILLMASDMSEPELRGLNHGVQAHTRQNAEVSVFTYFKTHEIILLLQYDLHNTFC